MTPSRKLTPNTNCFIRVFYDRFGRRTVVQFLMTSRSKERKGEKGGKERNVSLPKQMKEEKSEERPMMMMMIIRAEHCIIHPALWGWRDRSRRSGGGKEGKKKKKK